LVERRRSHLLPIARWAKELSLGTEKVDSSVYSKELTAHITTIITNYHDAIKVHRKKTHDCSRPAPTEGSSSFTDDIQRQYVEDIRQMLHVTMFDWTDKASLKKAETMIKHTLPFSACKDERELVLATSEGWSLRKMLGVIVKNAGGVSRDTMTWWDGFSVRPKNIARIDREDIPEVIEGESKGYRITRMGRMDDVRKTNVDAIKKVVDLVMKHNLGLLTSNKTSSSIRDPLRTLCEVGHVCAQVVHILTPLLHRP
jgi:hypothetical protein